MSLTITWSDTLIRILLTVIAGAAIGFERSERGHVVGLRTTLLVGLAACLAMLQANWLMNSTGKAPDSFVVLDLMRLPLGILSGVGFIGAGAIWRRDDLVRGVTTAATLWFITVIGLCFGGGQLALGLAGTVLGLLILSSLRLLERYLKQDRTVDLVIRWDTGRITEDVIHAAFTQAGLRVIGLDVTVHGQGNAQESHYTLQYAVRPIEHRIPPALLDMARQPGITQMEWKVRTV